MRFASTTTDVVIAVGGGSTIDGVKAAAAWSVLGGGAGWLFRHRGGVSKALKASGRDAAPDAVQTAAGSGAHLTKYANVTFPDAGQKKLMVDEAWCPARAVFDYSVTKTVPVNVSLDGALDGMSHLFGKSSLAWVKLQRSSSRAGGSGPAFDFAGRSPPGRGSK